MNRLNQKILIAALLSFSATAQLAQAASFDCAKAQAKVEKLICSDAELSKLDEDLEISYRAALQDKSRASDIRQEQKQWLKERNRCDDAACLLLAYGSRISELPTRKVRPRTKSDADEYVWVGQDPEQTGELLVHIEPDPTVCKLYEENLNYFAHQNAAMSCNRPIAPQFKDRIQEVEWEDLKPADYPELFRQLVLYMSGGRDKAPDGLKRHEGKVATREYVFRRARLELRGKLQWEGPIYGLVPPQQYYSGNFYIVQYGSNSTDTRNPIEPCKQVRGSISLYDEQKKWSSYGDYLNMYEVNAGMDAVIGKLGGLVRREQGEHLRLIDGKPYVEKNDFDASIYLLRINSRYPDSLESLCKYQFNPSQIGR